MLILTDLQMEGLNISYKTGFNFWQTSLIFSLKVISIHRWLNANYFSGHLHIMCVNLYKIQKGKHKKSGALIDFHTPL